MLLAGVIGALLLLLAWDYLRKKHRIDAFARSKITGPRCLPIVGCAFELITLGPGNLIPYIGGLFQRYGKTFRIWVLQETLIYTKDIRHFEAVLSSTTLLQKGDLYRILRCWLNDGLLLSYGKKWHSRRKIFTSAFHFKVLEHYVDVFDEQSAIMVQKLRPLADGQTPVEMLEKVCLAALDVITEAAMGVKVNAQSDAEFPYVKALKSVVHVQPNRMLKLYARYDWLFRLTAPFQYRKLMQDIQTMHDFTIRVIEERRASLQRAIADGSYQPLKTADVDIGAKQQMALLDILLQASIDGKPLTNADICEEVDTFVFEGDDTTTSGISHALYCISRHPQVQQRLFTEVRNVMGADKNAPINMQQLQELKYMECVIKETLRMYPPVPAIGRKTHKDIEIDGVVFPANSSIYLITYFAHRDADNFPDPLSFIPERFAESEEEAVKRNPFAYTPFSAGPKNCIGQKFAMLEMKTLLSKMLRHYELLPLGPEVQPSMNLILRSTVGINIGMKPRIY